MSVSNRFSTAKALALSALIGLLAPTAGQADVQGNVISVQPFVCNNDDDGTTAYFVGKPQQTGKILYTEIDGPDDVAGPYIYTLPGGGVTCGTLKFTAVNLNNTGGFIPIVRYSPANNINNTYFYNLQSNGIPSGSYLVDIAIATYETSGKQARFNYNNFYLNGKLITVQNVNNAGCPASVVGGSPSVDSIRSAGNQNK